MPTVQDILATKGEKVFSIHPGATVLDAVHKMNQHKLGALVVMDDEQVVVGMFTERDVLRRVVGDELDPRSASVAETMTREVICCPPNTDLDEISTIMKNRRVRHIPVCDEFGRLHGLISIGDVNAMHATHQEAQITFLNDYIYGRV